MTELTPSAAGPSSARASFLQRFAAYLIDGVVLGVVYVVIWVALGRSVAYAVDWIVSLGYFVYFEGGPTGQTLGKRALGIRVVDFRNRTGESIGYPRAFVRYLGRILSGFICFLGYLWMLWDKEKQTWHDKLAGSVVVPAT